MRRKMRKGRVPRGYTEAQRAEMWERWGRGESMKAIGRLFGKEGGSVYGQLAPYGGIRPRRRCRSPLALTLAEREEISRGVAAGRSMRSTSRLLGRAASTVSREIGRNGGSSVYRATEAEDHAWGRARRPRRCRLSRSPELRQLVEEQLRRDWSPEQIAGWLKRNYPEDESCRASHETIYRGLYLQPGGALEKGLTRHLPTRPLDSPLPARHPQRPRQGPYRRHGLHPRAPDCDRRSRRTRSLGRRSVGGIQEQPYRDVG